MTIELDKLHNMDCIKGMEQIPAGTIDLAFADPPFNIGYKYDVYEDRKAADEYLAWTKKWGQAVVTALKPTGTFWLAIGDDFAAELKLIFQRDLGLTCRSWVIWYYTFGVNCKYKFSRSHTHLFHFVKDPKKFTFNTDAIRVPSARQLVYADSRADKGGRLPDDTWILRPQDTPDSFTDHENTWYFPRVCGTFKERAGFHGCQMPEQLLARIIRSCSNPNDLVLDPFTGSGTTLITAKKLGRRFVGFELSKNYANRVRERLNALQPGEALSGVVNPITSAPSTANGKRRDKSVSTKVDPVISSLVRATKEDIDRGIIEAFLLVRDGWSADRVVVDPDLNLAFLEKCKRLGVAGPDDELNRRLYRLRKSAQLHGLPRSKRVTFPISPIEVDRIEFALEIAIQRFKAVGMTLDDALCDPKASAKFDADVYSMIPKPYPPFVIRSLALRLRKRASDYRKAAANLPHEVGLPLMQASPFDPKVISNVPQEAGVYWLWAPETKLYVGSAANLQKRLEYQFTATRFDFWGNDRNSLQLAYTRCGDTPKSPIAHQSRWIRNWKPVGNYEDFAASSV